MNCWNIWRI